MARRHPDIRASEAQFHAATAEAGQVEADFYLKVTIDAGFGFQSFSFRDFGFWNARAWNVGPSITLPIFQDGRLTGQLELKKSAQRDAAIGYRKTFLSAWKDVDDALTAYSTDQARRDELSAQVETNRRAYVLAGEQYRHGMTNFLDVLDAERRVLRSETDFTDMTSTVSGDLVRLYLSLGGGWESVFPAGRRG
nr:TolC family protein [Acetobacter oeni]